MRIAGFEFSIKRNKPQSTELTVVEPEVVEEVLPQAPVERRPLPMSMLMSNNIGTGRMYHAVGYDGEKNLGEMGPIKQYWLDFDALRWRSKQLYLESDICHIVINRSTQWVVGSRLKLKSEPQVTLLDSEGIKIDAQAFSKSVEAWWKIYSNSKLADYAGQRTLNALTAEARKESKVCGDMLVILRVINNIVKVQHIDATNVGTPPGLNILPTNIPGVVGYDFVGPNGNRIRNGVEINERGQHIAYWVRKGVGAGIDDYQRVQARGTKSGLLFAYMVYSKRRSIDDTRGMSFLAVIMETAKKLERYLGAALGAAEERQNIPFFFEHGVRSNQEDPMAGRRARGLAGRADSVDTDLPTDDNGEQKANDVAASTRRTVVNLPNDVTIKAIDSQAELDVPGFATFHVDLICAAADIPPNVAMSKYEDSFSASRMAGKDWEHTFMAERDDFSIQYLDPIYELQLFVLVLTGKIQAPGYLKAVSEKNEIAVNAFLFSRWVGDKFPDIDPLKTVKYLREALGPAFAHMPLMDLEAAAEELMQGDYSSILKQSSDELKEAAKLGILPEKEATTGEEETGNDGEEGPPEEDKPTKNKKQ